MTSIDTSELDLLAADLTKAAGTVQRAAAAIVARGALNVTNDARRFASGIAHAPYYPASIGYDILPGLSGTITAEIGPDKAKPQGALGNILEYGTSKNAPLTHLGPALDLEAPKFLAAILAAAGMVLR